MQCRMTNLQCTTPAMCAPFGGCQPPSPKIQELEQRVERLERIVESICPDKSDDI